MSYLRVVSNKEIPYEITDDEYLNLPVNMQDRYRKRTVYDDDPLRRPQATDKAFNSPGHNYDGTDDDDPME